MERYLHLPPAAPSKIIDRIPKPDPVPSPALPGMPEKVLSIHVKAKKITLTLKDGKTEIYDFGNPQQKAAFEKKYGPYAAIQVQEPTPDPHPANGQSPVIIDRKDEQSNLEE